MILLIIILVIVFFVPLLNFILGGLFLGAGATVLLLENISFIVVPILLIVLVLWITKIVRFEVISNNKLSRIKKGAKITEQISCNGIGLGEFSSKILGQIPYVKHYKHSPHIISRLSSIYMNEREMECGGRVYPIDDLTYSYSNSANNYNNKRIYSITFNSSRKMKLHDFWEVVNEFLPKDATELKHHIEQGESQGSFTTGTVFIHNYLYKSDLLATLGLMEPGEFGLKDSKGFFKIRLEEEVFSSGSKYKVLITTIHVTDQDGLKLNIA